MDDNLGNINCVGVSCHDAPTPFLFPTWPVTTMQICVFYVHIPLQSKGKMYNDEEGLNWGRKFSTEIVN